MMLNKKIPVFSSILLFLALVFATVPTEAQYNAFKDPSASGIAASLAGAPDFKAVDEEIKGGKIAVGATAFVVILFKNQGLSLVTVNKVSLYPSSNVSAQVALNQCADAPLAADAQCAITISVKGLVAGSWRVDALVDHNGRSRLATASISGEVEPAPPEKDEIKRDVEVSPGSLDFGTSPGGIALVRPVTLKNLSADPVQIKGITLDGPEKSGFAYASKCPQAMQPGESCNIIVTWQPTSRGLAQGVLAIQHSGKSGMVQAEIKGTLQPPPAETAAKESSGSVQLSPISLDFGTSAGGIALVRSVVLSNHSAEDVEVWNVDMNVPHQSGFSYDSRCPETLRPDESCDIVITWQPTSKGLAQGILTVEHSGKSGMVQTEVKGILQPPADGSKDTNGKVDVSPESMDFGTSAGGIPLVRSVVVTNHLPESIKVQSVTLNAPEQAGFTYKSECPETLPSEGMCNVIVTWQPTSKGLAQGVLAIQHSGKGGLVQTELKGLFQPPPQETAKDTSGKVSVAPEDMDFGTSAGGIPLVRSIEVSNHQSEAVHIKNVSLNAPDQSGFSYKSQCPETLPLEGICDVIVTWQPTSKGLAQGVLTIEHSGKGGLVQTNLKGLFQPPPVEAGVKDTSAKVDISPEDMDFGTSAGGVALVRSLVVSNHLQEGIKIQGVTLNAPERAGFSYKSQCPETLLPESMCSIIVTWQPTSKGLVQGVLTVQHSGKGNLIQSALKGLFQPPQGEADKNADGKVDISPSNLDFGISVGGSPLKRSIVVSNNSPEDVDIWDVSMNAPDRSGFSYDSQCPETLRSGEACNVIVTWLPTSKGLTQGVLTVEHSGKSGMAQTELQGTFQPPAAGEKGKNDNEKVSVSPDSMDFGTSNGGIPLVRSVVVSNHLPEAIKIQGVKLSAPEQAGFTYKSECPETLPPEGMCNVIVTWQPTSRGLAQGVLAIQHSGRGDLVQTELKGLFQPPPAEEKGKDENAKVSVSSDSVDFGTSDGGIPLVRSVVVSNHLPEAIKIQNVSLSAPEKSGFSYKSQCPETLPSEDMCNVIVTWQPTSKGQAQGVLAIQHSGKGGLVQTELKGLFQPPSAETAAKNDNEKVSAAPDSMDFGTSDGGIPLVRSVVVSNHLTEAVKILGVTLSASEKSGYSYKSQCPETLPPDGVCNVVVTWQPTSKGMAQGVLAIQHSGKGGLVLTELKGIFQQPAAELDKNLNGKVDIAPASLDFGTSAGGSALKRSIVVSNNSPEDVDVWDVSLDVSEKSGFSYDSQCPETLRSGEACNVIVTWLPTSKGLTQGVLTVEHSGKSGMAQTELQGIFQPPSAEAAAKNDNEKVSVSPDSMDFGTSSGGMALVRSVVMSNHLREAVKIQNISLNASDQSGFSYKSQCPETLQPEDMCNVIITWQPGGKGLAQGVLAIKHSGKGGLVQTELKGLFQPPATEDKSKNDNEKVSASPDSMDFGTSAGGMALVRSVVVNNHLTEAINIQSVTLSAPEKSGFSYKSQCPETLPPEGVCSVIVTWQPTGRGLAQGVLAIQHSGKGGLVLTELKGLFQPLAAEEKGKNDNEKMSATPDSMDFGTSAGGIPLVRSIVVSNHLTDAVKIQGVTLSAPDQAGFSYKSQCPETLQPEDMCNVIVTWKPTSKGLAQGVLAIQHSGKGGLLQTELKGLFQPPAETASKDSLGKVEVSPASLDFGTSAGANPLVRSVVLSNHLPEAIKIQNVSLDAPEQIGLSYKSQCPETLATEGMCNIIVTWQPTSKGLAQGVLAIQHSGKGVMVQTEIKGVYQPPSAEVAAKDISSKVDISPENMDFGTSAGGIPLVRSVVLSNNSPENIEIWDINMDVPEKSGFTYDSQCPETLRPGESCNIIITWQPTSKGLAQGLLVVQHSGKSGMSRAEVKGIYQPPVTDASKDVNGKVQATPESLDFGSSPGGISVVRSVILTNTAEKDVDIKGIALNVPDQSGFSYKSQCPATLSAGEACNIIVTWLPTTRGVAQGVLVVQHTGKSGMTKVDVKGSLQPEAGKTADIYPSVVPDRGLLVSDKEKIDFGSDIKDESAITMTLVNSGSVALTLKSIDLSGVENDLDISDKGCVPEMVLKPGEACPLSISWLPTHGGAILDSLQITHTGARGVLVIPVKGSADKSVSSSGGDKNSNASAGGGIAAGSKSVDISNVPIASGNAQQPAVGQASSTSSGTGGAVDTTKTMKQTFGSYTVTSHSSTRAVINGPGGGQVVRDGEDIIIEGVDCSIAIVPAGVILSSDGDKVLLPFDGSLRLLDKATSSASPQSPSPSPPPASAANVNTNANAAGFNAPASASKASLLPPNLTAPAVAH